MRIQPLREKRGTLLAEAQQMLDRADAEGGRALTAQETQRLEAIMAETTKLAQEIESIQRGDSIEAEARRVLSAKGPGRRFYAPVGDPVPNNAWRSGFPPMHESTHPTRTWAATFGRPMQDNGGFEGVEDFFRAIHLGQADSRLIPAFAAAGEGHSTYSDPHGGFAVPPAYGAMLMDKSLEDEIVRPRCQVWPMTTQTLRIPAFDGQNHTGGLFGGLVANWSEEGAAIADTRAKFTKKVLNARKLAAYGVITNEMLADGVAGFETTLLAAMAKTVGWYLDSACFTGTGVGMPSGLLSDRAMITVTKEPGQDAGTILYDNVVKMFARAHPISRLNGAWFANSDTIPQLLNMSILIGAGGSQIPVLKEDGSGGFTLLTRPVIFTEKLPTLGLQGDIIFADLSQYAIGLRQEIFIARSEHVGFQNDTTHYRVIIRADGMGTWKSAITPKNGNSLSWVVSLEDRT